MNQCIQCKSPFQNSTSLIDFLNRASPVIAEKKYKIPEPSLCPDCRMKQRIRMRNFFHLYHRQCDKTSKQIISMYDKDVAFPVYETKEWWSDDWSALDYGRDFDFSKPFFEQLHKLYKKVPQMAIANFQCENTDYCNLSFNSQNCYLVFGNVDNEDCCYGHIVWKSKDCFDCLYVYKSERCYQCIDCINCYNISFSNNAENCTDSQFLINCHSCKNCFGCVGLKNKEYYIFNQPHSREEYEKKIKQFNRGNINVVTLAKKKLQELVGEEIVKHYHGFGCENVTGDYLYNCKNTTVSFDAKNCEDSMYCATVESLKDCSDINYSPWNNELCYGNVAIAGYHLLWCHNCVGECSNLIYCDNCYATKDCFGCVGLNQKQYCIFNKQYTKEAYEKLVLQIITHMQSTKEWGEFFPYNFSEFAYNETMAQEYFPLTQEEVASQGLKWKEKNIHNDYKGPKYKIPDDIKDIDESICKQILTCEKSGQQYKIIPFEFTFYKEQNLPIPRHCPDQRHKDRMAARNPRKLWLRNCEKCNKSIQTTYSQDRPEHIYCEECYHKEAF
jgi:hypothetical protein